MGTLLHVVAVRGVNAPYNLTSIIDRSFTLVRNYGKKIIEGASIDTRKSRRDSKGESAFCLHDLTALRTLLI